MDEERALLRRAREECSEESDLDSEDDVEDDLDFGEETIHDENKKPQDSKLFLFSVRLRMC